MGTTYSDKEIEALTRYITDCKAAGMPKDQIDRFLTAAYFPHKMQMKFHAACRQVEYNDVRYILCGGSRAGGKTRCVTSQAGIDDAQRYPKLKILFLRKVQKAAARSFVDVTKQAFAGLNCKFEKGKITFQNGSQMIFDGFNKLSELDKYQGLEYDLIMIEELTQLPAEIFNLIDSCCRTSRRDGWKPRLYLTTNPNGIGHRWVKERFIMPFRAGREHDTQYIPWNYEANPFIDKQYGKYLQGLGGELGKAWRDGDWDLNEGAAFAFDERKHVIDTLPEFDDKWITLRGIDYGYAAPYCCLWAKYNPHIGRVIVYREDYKKGLTSKEQAERILMLTGADENVLVTYCDPAMFGRKAQEVVTSDEEVYRNVGITLTAGSNFRQDGKRKVDNLLLDKADGRPGLLIHKSCENLIAQLETLVYDDEHVEDVNTRQEDHAYDALRYLLTRVHDPMGNVYKQLDNKNNNFTVYKDLFRR